ncbi:Trp biosynthesis-associated membrane protein [Arthrobacter sp. 260]|uniref:Trp biosynthesis-associated membrane protein n=1 Tax=Arthrobacter sp. 260 TaxID=2735314 RepID=UPI001490A0C4|nr:Trp biosynthesis-associated membrane protein [Arthrobacter sp. 260]NOJ61205.1 Trp biosynthesis-associated membrane protein [Arthrobacter sp. 260]
MSTDPGTTDGQASSSGHSKASATPKAPSAWQRKGTVILATVLFSLLAFASTTQTWLTVILPQDAVQTPNLTIPGSDAATAVTAFALVSLAAALAVSIAGRIARILVVAILLIAGVGIVWNSLLVVADPTGAAAPAIGEAIGVSTGSGATLALTVFPWLAAAAGVLLTVTAVWMLLASRGWNRSKRYEKVADENPSARKSTAHSDEIDSWDQLTKGKDPTT